LPWTAGDLPVGQTPWEWPNPEDAHLQGLWSALAMLTSNYHRTLADLYLVEGLK
jgi:hypothetical protein